MGTNLATNPADPTGQYPNYYYSYILSRRYLSPFPCSAGGSVNFHVFFVEYLLTQIHLTLLPWEAQMVSTTGENLMKNLLLTIVLVRIRCAYDN
jgi:hypothetical protein